MHEPEDKTRNNKLSVPHLGRYNSRIRCRLDTPLRKALEHYCDARNIGICDAIRLAICALVTHAGYYDDAWHESFWSDD